MASRSADLPSALVVRVLGGKGTTGAFLYPARHGAGLPSISQMPGRLTQSDFITRAIGTPWVRWRSDWDAVDCFGLIVLYFREVLGIELGAVPQTDIASGFDTVEGWEECDPEDGATCWMAWRHGSPTHCGVIVAGGMVLHSEGSDDHPGSVRLSRLAAVQRVYGHISFYRYTPC